MQTVKYRGFELYKGGYILLIELEKQTFLGVKIPCVMGEVDLSRIQSLHLKHEHRGKLFKWELSPCRQRVVSALELTIDKSSKAAVYCFFGFLGCAATSIVFPPAAAAIIPLAQASLTTFAIGLSAALVEDLVSRVKYVTFEVQASIPESGNKLSNFTTPVWFSGRMEPEHAKEIYSQWKNKPKPGTDLVLVDNPPDPPDGDFQGEAQIIIDASAVGAVS